MLSRTPCGVVRPSSTRRRSIGRAGHTGGGRGPRQGGDVCTRHVPRTHDAGTATPQPAGGHTSPDVYVPVTL